MSNYCSQILNKQSIDYIAFTMVVIKCHARPFKFGICFLSTRPIYDHYSMVT